MNEINDFYINCNMTWVVDNRRFSRGTDFRCMAKFTSDLSPSYTVVVNFYSELENQDFYAKLFFPFLNLIEAQRLAKHSELLLMDAYKVLAVCRNLNITSGNT